MAYTKAQREAKKATEAGVANESSAPAATAPVTATRKKLPKMDLNTMVKVRNGSAGVLVYVSKKTGYEFRLDGYGAEDYIDLGELLSCRNSSPAFFEKNWFIIDDPAVCEFLKIGKFYEKSLNLEQLEGILDMDNADIPDAVSGLPDGQRVTLSYLAAQRIRDGALDSKSKIEVLEQTLGCSLSDS